MTIGTIQQKRKANPYQFAEQVDERERPDQHRRWYAKASFNRVELNEPSLRKSATLRYIFPCCSEIPLVT